MYLYFVLIHSSSLLAWEGISVKNKPKYSEGFKHLDYVNPSAHKGGRLVLGWHGGFDTTNAFTAKGISPLLLEEFIFQKLGQSTLDETISSYPELAESFEVAKDHMSMKVTLKKNITFSDQHPITAEDVKFSFELFQSDHVNSLYKTYWQDIKTLKVIDDHTLLFIFKNHNLELPFIATQITILPKHIYGKGNFSKDYNSIAIGSGPYVLKDFKRGAYIKYGKNENFWGHKDPFYQGRYNFDEIVIKYYKDQTAMVEAFKKGEFDLYINYVAKIWTQHLQGKKFTSNWIVKKKLPHSNNLGSQGFFFNLRKSKFKNIQVRKAIALAFDFDWTNEKLFYNQYQRNASFFQNSIYQASQKPDTQETQVLKKLMDQYPTEIPKSIFTHSMGSLGKGLSIKKKLMQAHKILADEGFKLKDGVLQKGDVKLEFDFMLSNQMMARVVEPFLKNLKRLGIIGRIRVLESSVYLRELQKRNFDVVVLALPQSQSPGNEQIDFWHSDSAGDQYSRNYFGLKNKAVDEMIKRIVYSKTQADLILNTKVLDRLLYNLHITVHNWHITYHRVAFWNKFNQPKIYPLYYNPFNYVQFMWHDKAKDQTLQKAIQGDTEI